MAATSTAKKSKTAPAGMPIEDYDRLSVKAILPRLTELSAAELQAVVAHEKAGRNRVTLLQGVRKVELAREAAARRSAPESHLTIVDDVEEPAEVAFVDDIDDASDVVFVDDIDDASDVVFVDDIDDASDVVFVDDTDDATDVAFVDDIDEPAEVAVAAEPAKAKRGRIGAVARPAAGRAARATAPRATAKSKAAVPVPEPVSEPVAAKEKKPRPAVKAATWEEEVRLELPRRIEATAAAYELEFEPAPIALVPPVPAAPTSSSTSTPRVTRPAKVRRKFEGAALVMAAVLAVLLGLAIGTVLTRSGSISAEPAPPAVSVEAGAVPAGG